MRKVRASYAIASYQVISSKLYFLFQGGKSSTLNSGPPCVASPGAPLAPTDNKLLTDSGLGETLAG